MSEKRKCSVDTCRDTLSRKNKSGLCQYHKIAAQRARIAHLIKDCETCGDELDITVKGSICGVCRSKAARASLKKCTVCAKTIRAENISGLCMDHYRPDAKRRRNAKQMPFTMDDVILAASRVTYTPVDQINGKSRPPWIIRIRQAIAHIAKAHYSFAEIGRRMGGRDHSTIGSSCEKAKAMIARNKQFAQLVKEIEREALAIADRERRIIERIAA